MSVIGKYHGLGGAIHYATTQGDAVEIDYADVLATVQVILVVVVRVPHQEPARVRECEEVIPLL